MFSTQFLFGIKRIETGMVLIIHTMPKLIKHQILILRKTNFISQQNHENSILMLEMGHYTSNQIQR